MMNSHSSCTMSKHCTAHQWDRFQSTVASVWNHGCQSIDVPKCSKRTSKDSRSMSS